MLWMFQNPSSYVIRNGAFTCSFSHWFRVFFFYGWCPCSIMPILRHFFNSLDIMDHFIQINDAIFLFPIEVNTSMLRLQNNRVCFYSQ